MTTNNDRNSESVVTVASGGSGVASKTAYSVLCGGTTSTAAQQTVSGLGTSLQVLTSTGASSLPTWQTAAGGSGVWNVVESQTVTDNVSSIDFEGIDDTYDFYIFQLNNVTPATNDAILYCRVGTGAAPSYKSGASDYAWDTNEGSDVADSEMEITIALESTAGGGDGVCCEMLMANPSAGGMETTFTFLGGYKDGTLAQIILLGAGQYLSNTPVTAVRFIMSTGDIDYGIITLYGVSNS